MGLLSLGAVSTNIANAQPKNESETKLKKKIGLDSGWDVIVIGGGPSGCTAAISAACEGARTLLIEANGRLGGLGTAGMVPTWSPFSDGERVIYRGLAEKVFNASKVGVSHVKMNDLNWVPIDPERLTLVYDRMVTETGVKVLFFSRICQVEMDSNDRVDAVVVANKNGLRQTETFTHISLDGKSRDDDKTSIHAIISDANGDMLFLYS